MDDPDHLPAQARPSPAEADEAFVRARAPAVARRAAAALREVSDAELPAAVHRYAGTLATYGIADAASLLTVADSALGAGGSPDSVRGLVGAVVAELEALPEQPADPA